jgi:hypothetical protein
MSYSTVGLSEETPMGDMDAYITLMRDACGVTRPVQPDADTLPSIERPNGKLYRPRAVRVDYMDDEDNWREEYPYKTVVLGTHDVDAARERAVQGRVCQYLINPRIDWLRLGYESGRLCWIHDAERGAACVVFDESDDPPEVSAVLRGDQP